MEAETPTLWAQVRSAALVSGYVAHDFDNVGVLYLEGVNGAAAVHINGDPNSPRITFDAGSRDIRITDPASFIQMLYARLGSPK